MKISNLYPEIYGAIAAGSMSLLHEVSNSIPNTSKKWLGFMLKIVIANAWGATICGLLKGMGYTNPHLIISIASISGWLSIETTIAIIKKNSICNADHSRPSFNLFQGSHFQ